MEKNLLKYIFMLQFFLAIIFSLNAQEWEWRNPLPQGNRINDVYAFSNSEAIAVGATGLVMKTTNAGDNWTISKLETSEWLYAVHFADANNGYIAHGDGNVSKTVDAGANWTLVTKPNSSAIYDIWAKSSMEVLCLDYSGKIFKSTDGGSTWGEITNPGSGSTYLNDIYFFDGNLGFIVGGNTSYSRSEIFKTTDGGSTWNVISSPVESALTSVTFVDSNTGFIVGEGGAILKTVDAGETWSLYSNSGASYPEYTSGAIYTKFSTVLFFDQNNGLAAGEARVYYTTDGGTSWAEGYYGYGDNSQTVYINGTSSAIALGDDGLLLSTANKGQTWAKDFDYNTESFYGLSFKGSVGYATATGGKVLKSTDNGETWTYLTQSGDYKSALTISDQNAIIAGTSVYASSDGGSSWTYKSIDGSGSIWGLVSPKNSNIVYGVGSNRVIKSTDNGVNWANLTSPYASTLYDVCFVDDNTGVAVGGKSGETKIYRTTDGASSWQEITSPVTNGALYGIDFINETTGFACGTDTTLLKTTDGGVTWSKVILNSDLPSYSDDLRRVRFGDESNGVAVGVTGIVFITTDGGVTWTIDNSVPTQNFFYACDYSIDKLVVAGTSGTILAKNVTLQNATIPTLTTTTVTKITQTTASSGGAITDNGGADITAKGVVWSTTTNPTLESHVGFTSNGTGTTEFNSDLTGLTAGITYYVRAYATNSAGTGYGNEVEFTTYSENVVEDFEGNIYNTVIIGNQVWMAENLRATKYADGTNIVTGLNDTEWNTTTNGALAIYPHSEVEGLNSEEDVVNAYGMLYNWFAASNEKGICPTGWKVPSVADWDELLTFIIDQGYSNENSVTTDGAGNALKSCRQVDSPLGGDCATNEHPRWDYYADQYGTNAFDFNGLPAGSRMSTGEYLNVGKMGRFWTSDEDNLNQYNAVRRDLGFGNGRLSDGSITKTNGISIRCIKESEVQVVVPEVTTTTVTNITQTTASSGGAITDDGGADITAKGVVWSTSTSPTLESHDGFTSNGTGTSEFNSDLTDLTAGTTYYVRAYATNSAGTGYGNEVQFTTEVESTTSLPLPFNDSFEGDISGWSTFNGDGDDYTWEISTDDPRTGTKHLQVFFNLEGNNDWIISPLLNLPSGEPIKLSFWAKSTSSTYLESFDVKLILNDEQVENIASVVDVPNTYTEYVYDLSDYAGMELNIAVVCVSVDKLYLFLDDFSCVVDEASIELPTLTTTTVTNITQTTASSGGAITNDGGADITAKGVVWSTTTNPTLDASDGVTNDGTGTTEFNSDLTGLTAGTTYYVRAYATNSAGTGYGNEVEFATEEEVVVPTLTTTTVTNITQTTASSGGAITDDGGADITAKGVVWSTSTSPTLESHDGFTSNGTGTSEFNSDLTELTAGTTYYVRAYATNSAGTGYGNEVQFTTQESSAEAKPLPFTEDFESGMGDWTVIDQDEDGEAWAIYDDADYARSGTKSARIKYNISGNNDWLISPLLDLPADESIKFTLWARSYGSTFPESFDIKIISNDGQQVDDIASETGVPETYTEYTYNLSTYAGQQVKIAIVCVSVDQFYLNIDDVSCVVDEASIELPTLTTTTVTNITQTTASSGGAITNDGGADITAKGLVWSTSTSPTLDANDGFTSDGTGTTEFNSDLTGLTAGTTYHVRAYATNSAGTGYGNEVQFTTEEEIVIPTLTTTTVTNITQTTASSGGAITDDGGADIMAKGVVWSTSESPTLASNDGYSENGTGTAEFTSELTGLTANTTYYVRAYATNSAGTAYGDQKSFTTTPTSVDIELLANISIYPNPFTSILTLESEKGISQVVVMNVSGQVVLARQANGESKLLLDANGLDTGLYIVKLTVVDGTNFHIRVVKR
jgi:uncharacterized protein (TIGR02145 family)